MSPFTPDALRFLAELAKNNNKAWFDKNKARYEKSLRDPFVMFLHALEPKLRKVTTDFPVDARPHGGSLSRIYRDTRFAKDKSPYKTGLFVHLRHKDGVEGGSPGLYMHFEPKSVFVGGGIWHPDTAALLKIRAAIDKDPARWKKVKSGRALGSSCSMVGESLKRPPPGYDASHPLIEDLKRKDFALSIPIPDKDVTSAKFVDEIAAGFKAVMPFVSFLGEAVGVAR